MSRHKCLKPFYFSSYIAMDQLRDGITTARYLYEHGLVSKGILEEVHRQYNYAELNPSETGNRNTSKHIAEIIIADIKTNTEPAQSTQAQTSDQSQLQEQIKILQYEKIKEYDRGFSAAVANIKLKVHSPALIDMKMLMKLQQENAQLKHDLEEAKRLLSEQKANNAGLLNDIEKLVTDLENLKKEQLEKQEKIERTNEEKTILQTELTKINSQLELLKVELEQSNQTKELLKTELNRTKEQLNQVKEQSKIELERINKELQQYKTTSTPIIPRSDNTELDRLNKELQNKIEQLTKEQELNRELQGQIAKKQQELDEQLTKGQKELQNKIEQFAKEQRELNGKLIEIGEIKTKIEEVNKQLIAEKTILTQTIQRLTEQLSKANLDLQNRNIELAQAKELEQKYKKELESLRTTQRSPIIAVYGEEDEPTYEDKIDQVQQTKNSQSIIQRANDLMEVRMQEFIDENNRILRENIELATKLKEYTDLLDKINKALFGSDSGDISFIVKKLRNAGIRESSIQKMVVDVVDNLSKAKDEIKSNSDKEELRQEELRTTIEKERKAAETIIALRPFEEFVVSLQQEKLIDSPLNSVNALNAIREWSKIDEVKDSQNQTQIENNILKAEITNLKQQIKDLEQAIEYERQEKANDIRKYEERIEEKANSKFKQYIQGNSIPALQERIARLEKSLIEKQEEYEQKLKNQGENKDAIIERQQTEILRLRDADSRVLQVEEKMKEVKQSAENQKQTLDSRIAEMERNYEELKSKGNPEIAELKTKIAGDTEIISGLEKQIDLLTSEIDRLELETQEGKIRQKSETNGMPSMIKTGDIPFTKHIDTKGRILYTASGGDAGDNSMWILVVIVVIIVLILLFVITPLISSEKVKPLIDISHGPCNSTEPYYSHA